MARGPRPPWVVLLHTTWGWDQCIRVVSRVPYKSRWQMDGVVTELSQPGLRSFLAS